MHRFDRLRVLPLVLLLLCACERSDNDEDTPPDPEPPAPQRGELIGEAPTLVASYSPDELLALVSSNEVTQLLLEEVLTPECRIDVYHFEYHTIDPAGDITPASAALMVPNDSASPCQGERPIVLYAHGTKSDKAFNIADLEASDNGEGLLMAGVFDARPPPLPERRPAIQRHGRRADGRPQRPPHRERSRHDGRWPTAGDGLFAGRLRRHGDAPGVAGGRGHRHRVRADVGAVRSFGL
jgi:hypothetical protein